jgi:hypothetical protein
MNVASVAFPAVGSGQLLGYPIDHVIDCLINESKVAGQKSQCMKVGITIFTTIHPSKIYANYL